MRKSLLLFLTSFSFQAQQKKLTGAAIQLENLNEKMALYMREARRTELTKSEVAKTEESVTMYGQYGRCFIAQPKPALDKELEAATTKYQTTIKKTKDSITYFERQRDESSANLQEMLKSLQSMSQRA